MRWNEVFFASAWPYINGDPRPGDIVVFKFPKDPSLRMVKRVIALGNSTVEIVKGVTMVDGRPLQEAHLGGVVGHRDFSQTMSLVRVPAGSYFVMGDNRDNGDDSRYWGSVSRNLILARVDTRAPNNRSRGP
jgi:signal peptidase I